MAALELDHLAVPLESFPAIISQSTAKKSLRQNRLLTLRICDLEQAPKKLIDFFDKSLLQHFDFERFLVVRTIPFERKAL
jgi:hypothetical protein